MVTCEEDTAEDTFYPSQHPREAGGGGASRRTMIGGRARMRVGRTGWEDLLVFRRMESELSRWCFEGAPGDCRWGSAMLPQMKLVT
ncbi:hypothetical protein CEXT_548681 [Caerostris extrusa]|uniref:Uncharacterized protein n=1 Tax=Caerostris extrusa TaxID=172846 RepID=A0AAV4P3V4_CAEEX|nr:hypothetical protein CEXT_548681 [Caerostris extrusa]